MGWISWILVGLLAGFLAEKIMKTDMGLLANLGVGLVGAIVGGIIVDLLPFFSSDGGFIWSTIVATFGAVVLLWVVNKIKGRTATA